MAADSEEIIKILKETIAFHVKNSEEQQNTIASLREQVRELQQTVTNLNETLAELERKMFGSASERSRRKKKQKDDADGAESDPETKAVTVAEHTRTVKKEKTSREDLYADLPVENIYCDAAGEERICPECLDRTEMEHLGYEFVREELTIQEAVVKRTRYYRKKMICPVCKKEGDTTIVKGPVSAPLSKHGVSSPSMVAHVMYNKSVLCLPFYRQESDWKRKGVPLPRGTMARWYNECGTKYLLPIYERLHEELLKREIIHADEVPCQVLHEEGRRAQSRSYMWIFLSGNDGKPAVVLYDYQPGRKGEYVRSFLDGFKGLVHCDGYQAYGTLEDVVLLICLAHYPKSMIIRADSSRTSLTVHFQKYYSDNLCSLFSIQKVRYCFSLLIWNITIMKPFIIPFF